MVVVGMAAAIGLPNPASAAISPQSTRPLQSANTPRRERLLGRPRRSRPIRDMAPTKMQRRSYTKLLGDFSLLLKIKVQTIT
jgi:hypothetical protein